MNDRTYTTPSSMSNTVNVIDMKEYNNEQVNKIVEHNKPMEILIEEHEEDNNNHNQSGDFFKTNVYLHEMTDETDLGDQSLKSAKKSFNFV